jgi:hypothetical protein
MASATEPVAMVSFTEGDVMEMAAALLQLRGAAKTAMGKKSTVTTAMNATVILKVPVSI